MIKQPKLWLWISATTVAASIIIIVAVKPTLGIDFTGGSLIEITSPADVPTLRQALTNQFGLDVQVQATQDDSLLIRTTPLSQEQHQNILEGLREANLLTEELRFESIGPTIGDELRRRAFIAIGVAIAAMVVYLAYTFRQTAGLISSWKLGLAAAAALIHDLIVVTALFALLKPFGATIDTLFVTAMLAILGYSVNDTIIIFTRLKSEWTRSRSGNLLEIIDRATRTTLVRSLNTSFTTLLVLGSLLIFGGETIRWFVAALTAGTIIGTYSSIFVAPPVLFALAKRK